MIEVQSSALETEDLATANKHSDKTEFSVDSRITSMAEKNTAQEHGNRQFDAEKVARLKAQIARGEYEINPSRIVSKMIENKT